MDRGGWPRVVGEVFLKAFYRRLFGLALVRPGLWPAMVGAAWAFRAKGWHRRPPFLPLPSSDYVAWRMETAYGDPGAAPPTDELAGFLAWSAAMRRRMRREQGGRRGGRVAAKATAVLVVVGFAVWANLQAPEMEAAREAVAAAGYGGLLAASVVSGFNLVAPIPIVAFYPFLMESGFSPVPTLALIALGMTTGDLLGYLVGDASRGLARGRLRGFRARVEKLHGRHPLLPLGLLFLYAAFAPVPNELLVIPLAFMGYRLAGVMTAVLLGNVIFNAWMAVGVSWLFGGG